MKRDQMRRAEVQSAGKSLADYPLRLYAHHMSEIFGVSLNEFYRLERHGEFVFAEHKPQIGRKTWSRSRIQAYDAGELRGLTESRQTLRVVGGMK